MSDKFTSTWCAAGRHVGAQCVSIVATLAYDGVVSVAGRAGRRHTMGADALPGPETTRFAPLSALRADTKPCHREKIYCERA